MVQGIPDPWPNEIYNFNCLYMVEGNDFPPDPTTFDTFYAGQYIDTVGDFTNCLNHTNVLELISSIE